MQNNYAATQKPIVTHWFLATIVIFCSFQVLAQTQVEVFVNSRGTNAIKKYDENGNYLGNFVAPNDGGLIAPEDILFHPDGTILVTGAGNSAIKRYNGQTGQYMGNFSSGYALETPSKMSIGWDSLIYVTQWGTTKNKVVRFDLNGQFVDEFTKIPAPNGLGHLWDANKIFYISIYGNGGNGTVQKFDTLGNSLGAFINSAILQGPTNIWFDVNGDMLVEDWTVGRVLRYSASGQYKGIFIDGLPNPEGIAFLPNGNLLIGDWGEDAVHLMDNAGNKLGYFTSGNGLADPNAVKVRLKEISATTSPTKIALELKINPNPASDQVRIQYSLEKTSNVQLTIVDALGKQVALLFSGQQSTGNQECSWKGLKANGSKAKAGVYFIRLEVGNDTMTERLVWN